jgi:hypothetical protein
VTAPAGALHLAAVAVTDCEWRIDGIWRQDVNTISSAAYLVAALATVAVVRRRGGPRALWVLAVATALEGVGSIAYHAGSSDLARFVHDVPLIAIVAFVVGWHVGRLSGAAERVAVIATLAAAGTAAVSWWAWPGSVLGVALGVAVVAAGVAARRAPSRLRSSPLPWSLVALAAVAVLAWVAGRPDSPLCSPGSWLQPHAVWHVVSAAVLVAWARHASEAAATRVVRSPGVRRSS